MFESISPPRRKSKASALGWLGALTLLLVVALALPAVLLREQILLYTQIQYHGAEGYPVLPAAPFPLPPAGMELKTFELDGLRFSIPAGSVDSLTMDEDLEGRLSFHLRSGMIVAIDPYVQPTPVLIGSATVEFEQRALVYTASPADFSWGASAEESRRLGEALARKETWFASFKPTEISQTKRQDWSGWSLRSSGLNFLGWLTTDESATGTVFVHRPAHVTADDDSLCDVVFGSFEVTRPPRGTFDADARRLVEEFEARPTGD